MPHVALFDCATLKEDTGTLVLTMLCNMFSSSGAPGTSISEVLCYQGSGEGPAARGLL